MNEPASCRDNWHVFEWSQTGDALTCHCGQRTIAVVLKQLKPEDVTVAR